MNLEIETYNTWRKVQTVILFLLTFLFLIGSILFFYIGYADVGLLSLALAALLPAVYVLLPRSRSKASYRWLCEQQHTQVLESDLRFTDEAVEYICLPTGGKMRFSYGQIDSIAELKHVILLGTRYDNGLALVLDKSGFRTGTLEDFKKFISEKCPGSKSGSEGKRFPFFKK